MSERHSPRSWKSCVPRPESGTPHRELARHRRLAHADIGRTPNERLAFGGGAHFCLGAHLARMEGQVAIGTLVQRTGGLELVSEGLEWGASLFRVRGRLPVRVKPA